jgi:biopolymer transport protein ExbD
VSVEFKGSGSDSGAMNLTPLIDVIFQLLVFFMLTSTFSYPALQLELPRASSEEVSAEAQALVLSLGADERLYLNREAVADDELETVLRERIAREGPSIVHFRGDRDVPYHRFVELMQTAGKAGAAGFYLIHEPDN